MMSYRSSFRGPIFALMAALLTLINAACQKRAEPNLYGLDSLLASKQFDAVEKRLNDYLEVHPESAQANMLMAQVALNREPQKPQVALDHLARIKSGNRSLIALVKLNEGKAQSSLGDNVRSEKLWREALRIDPMVPEAGWALLGLYYVEGRRRDAEVLGLALHGVEPDPRDRVQILLELVRQDARPIVPTDISEVLEPGVRTHPEDFEATVALAKAYIHDSRFDEGLNLLKDLVQRQPENAEAWGTLLKGLDESSRPEELEQTLGTLPRALADDPRFARYRGIAAQNRRDWQKAQDEFKRARRFDPLDSQVLYRLGRVYRSAGREAEAKQAEEDFRIAEAALREMLVLYNEANEIPRFGTTPTPDLYRRIAEARERLGYRAEALLWYRLVLRDQPDDSASLAAVTRLSDVKLPTLAEVLAEPKGVSATD